MISRILITILVYCFWEWLLCDIDPDKEYMVFRYLTGTVFGS